MLQTADDPPAYIIVKTNGWLTGSKDVLDKVKDPNIKDAVNPNAHKYRVHISMEAGDDRYAFVNTLMWIGSGCRRGHEGIPLSLFPNQRVSSKHVTDDDSYFRFLPRHLVSQHQHCSVQFFKRVIFSFRFRLMGKMGFIIYFSSSLDP